MVAVNQNDLRVKNAQNLIHSLTDDTSSYVFMGRPSQWETDIVAPMMPRQEAGEMSPPYPDNNWKDFYRTWNQMLSLKIVSEGDAFYMIPRINWTSGIVYDMYRHDYNKSNRSFSNAQNLYDAKFHVINQNRHVYVCLDNNNNSQSLVEPVNTTDEPFYTTDGYQWLRLYRVSDFDFRYHSTNNYIPINNNLVNKRPSGAVYTVKVDSPGNEYDDTGGDVPFYVCPIVGDGKDGIAAVTVRLGKIDTIRIINPGYGYTYGRLIFEANRVYKTVNDLQNGVNALNPRGDRSVQTTVIISPPGGWGYERTDNTTSPETEIRQATYTLARQLGGTRVGIFSSFKNNSTNDVCSISNDTIKDTYFRQVGLLQDPLGTEIGDGYRSTAAAYSALKVTRTSGNDSANYMLGEMIIQDHNDYTARGQVVGVDHIADTDDIYIRYIQDPYLHTDPTTGSLFPFNGSQSITGDTSGTTSVIDGNYNDDYCGQQYNSGMADPEVTRYTGLITFLENSTPILRQPTQTERVSLMIEY